MQHDPYRPAIECRPARQCNMNQAFNVINDVWSNRPAIGSRPAIRPWPATGPNIYYKMYYILHRCILYRQKHMLDNL